MYECGKVKNEKSWAIKIATYYDLFLNTVDSLKRLYIFVTTYIQFS